MRTGKERFPNTKGAAGMLPAHSIRVPFCLVLLALLIFPLPALGAEEGGGYLTYVGISAGSGFNRIEYKDWFVDKQDTKKISGQYFSGGVVFDIFANFLIGEFTLKYLYNKSKGDSATSVQCLEYSALGKYAYVLGKEFTLTAGLGMYLETPPSTGGYDGGAGFIASLGMVYDLGWKWKVLFDIIGRYGSFGKGQDSGKISYGVNLGIVYQIGRI